MIHRFERFSFAISEISHYWHKLTSDEMEKHGLKAEECVMIGDRPLDTEAGMAAGMLSILIDPENRFPDGKCDVRIHHPGELTDFIG